MITVASKCGWCLEGWVSASPPADGLAQAGATNGPQPVQVVRCTAATLPAVENFVRFMAKALDAVALPDTPLQAALQTEHRSLKLEWVSRVAAGHTEISFGGYLFDHVLAAKGMPPARKKDLVANLVSRRAM